MELRVHRVSGAECVSPSLQVAAYLSWRLATLESILPPPLLLYLLTALVQVTLYPLPSTLPYTLYFTTYPLPYSLYPLPSTLPSTLYPLPTIPYLTLPPPPTTGPARPGPHWVPGQYCLSHRPGPGPALTAWSHTAGTTDNTIASK